MRDAGRAATLKQHFQLMAGYNQRMNRAVMDASALLPGKELATDKGAFFGSIIGTLNHMLVGDTLWLKRFALHPAGFSSLGFTEQLEMPESLSEIVEPDLRKLRKRRQHFDAQIIALCDEATEADYQTALRYQSTAGKRYCKPFGHLVQHFFNHQTHHRGQLSTLLTQCGVDIGVTDLLIDIPDCDDG